MGKIAWPSAALFVLLIGISALSTAASSSFGPANAAKDDPRVPVTAAQSSNFNAIYYDYAGDTCFAAGRFWVFYYDGNQVGYVSSSDGISWTPEHYVNNASTGAWAFYCSGNALYYVMSSDPSGPTILYRRGNMSSDGIIRWDGPEGAFTAGGYLIRGISTIVDNSGRWWTTFSDDSPPLEVEVWECSAPGSCSWNQTGRWDTSDPSHGAYPQILSMESGNIAVVWTVPNAGGNLSIRFYDGRTWSATAELAGAYRMGSGACVSVMNSIGCAESNETSIAYAIATYSNGSPVWSEVKLLTGCSSSLSFQLTDPPATNCFASASADGESRVIVTYIDSSSTLGSFESVDGGFHWVSNMTLATSETGSPIRISSASVGGYIQAAWVSGASPPYNIRFIEVPQATYDPGGLRS